MFPTTGLLYGIGNPLALETIFDNSVIYFVLNPKSFPYNIFKAIMSSSNDALPALSPIPLTVVDIPFAPANTPVIEFITAKPKSLWQ